MSSHVPLCPCASAWLLSQEPRGCLINTDSSLRPSSTLGAFLGEERHTDGVPCVGKIRWREPLRGGVGLLRKGGLCTEGYGEVVPSCSLELGGAQGEYHYNRAVAGTEKERGWSLLLP